MPRELPPTLTEALGRRHREDVERIKALFEARRAQQQQQHDHHTLLHFERPNDSYLPAYARTSLALALCALAAFLLSRLS